MFPQISTDPGPPFRSTFFLFSSCNVWSWRRVASSSCCDHSHSRLQPLQSKFVDYIVIREFKRPIFLDVGFERIKPLNAYTRWTRLLRCRFGPPDFYLMWEPVVILPPHNPDTISWPEKSQILGFFVRFRGTVSSKGPGLSELGSQHRKSCFLAPPMHHHHQDQVSNKVTLSSSRSSLLFFLANNSNDHLENFCRFFISKPSRWSIEIEFLWLLWPLWECFFEKFPFLVPNCAGN